MNFNDKKKNEIGKENEMIIKMNKRKKKLHNIYNKGVNLI